MKRTFLFTALLSASLFLLETPVLYPLQVSGEGKAPEAGRESVKKKEHEGGVARKKKKPLTMAQKARLRRSIRATIQNSRLDAAREVVENCLKAADPERDRDLLAYTYWGKALLEGNSGEKDACLEAIRKAIEYGWQNAAAFEKAVLIQKEIRQTSEFREITANLRETVETRIREEWQGNVQEAIRSAVEGSSDPLAFSSPNLLPEGGFTEELIRGKPALLVITRVYHDGFGESFPALGKVAAEFSGKIPVAVLFYQVFADDTHGLELTKKYAEELGLAIPYGVVERSFVKPLAISSFPHFIFLTARGRIAYQQGGALEEAKLRFICEKLLELGGVPLEETSPGGEESPAGREGKEETTPDSEEAEKPAGESQAEPAEKDAGAESDEEETPRPQETRGEAEEAEDTAL